tara:strand:+ start:695 stop:883 length:189 start_codon:yes stop_codon:yes gene_type:complete
LGNSETTNNIIKIIKKTGVLKFVPAVSEKNKFFNINLAEVKSLHLKGIQPSVISENIMGLLK